MRIPKTFVPDKTLETKVKSLLSKKGLYKDVVNKYGFFKPHPVDYTSNCYLAIRSILKDEGYEDTYNFKSADTIRIELLKNQLLNNRFCLEGYTQDRKSVIIGSVNRMDEAVRLMDRFNEELKFNLKIKQYIGKGVWEDIEPE
ncbi:hypothetical protein FJZ53_01155 [Candidatus Woesearchaeota archaeon]|nr:hypothetical protein [Candidatus Woesearchaeota archaeon]